MSGILPILEELNTMLSYRERADWLKRLPLEVVLLNRGWLKKRFRRNRWPAAADYVDDVVTMMNAVRMPDGTLASGYGGMLLAAGQKLDESAKAREWASDVS